MRKVRQLRLFTCASEWSRFCEKGRLDEAVDAAEAIRQRGSSVPTQILHSLLQSCIKVKDLQTGRRVASLIAHRGYDSTSSWGNNLISLFESCGRLDEATRAFRRIVEPGAYTFRLIIAAYVKHGQSEQALRLFEEMQLSGTKPDNYVYIAVLKACGSTGDLFQGRTIHAAITKSGWNLNLHVGNTLIDMYAKCGSLDEARGTFDMLPRKDRVSWNVLLSGLAQHGRGWSALQLFENMQQQGIEPDIYTAPSVLKACGIVGALDEGRRIHVQIAHIGLASHTIVGNSLVDMYAKCGSVVEARQVFDKIVQKDPFSWNAMIAGYARSGMLEEACTLFEATPCKNVHTWSTMIAGFANGGQGQEAIQLFNCMQQQGIKPTRVTFLSVFKACSTIAALSLAKQVHSTFKKSGLLLDSPLGNTLISMYAKCGSLVDARDVFAKLRKEDVVSWTAMIAAYTHHGRALEALELFKQMQEAGFRPDRVTFLCLLSACAREGLLNDGYEVFQSMSTKFGIAPGSDHYSCMVDLFCRAGHLDQVELFIEQMPVRPDSFAWTSVLGGCLKYGKVELARRAFEAIIEVEPQNDAAYVLMSNMYAAEGMWDERAEVRQRMQIAGVRKVAARTWLEIDNQIHRFRVDDLDHPDRKDILAALKHVIEEIEKSNRRALSRLPCFPSTQTDA